MPMRVGCGQYPAWRFCRSECSRRRVGLKPGSCARGSLTWAGTSRMWPDLRLRSQPFSLVPGRSRGDVPPDAPRVSVGCCPVPSCCAGRTQRATWPLKGRRYRYLNLASNSDTILRNDSMYSVARFDADVSAISLPSCCFGGLGRRRSDVISGESGRLK
jgi:hypothetical protein